MLDSGNKAVTYVFSNLVREDDRELEEESEEKGGDGRRYEEIMPEQGGTQGGSRGVPEQDGSRNQPGPSKTSVKEEGGLSDKKEGRSEVGDERPRSCGEPIIVGGEGGGRQNILMGAELGSYDEVKVGVEVTPYKHAATQSWLKGVNSSHNLIFRI